MSKDKAYEAVLWERIEEQIPKLSKREARFRQVDKIPTLGAFMKAYEHKCSDCLLYRKEIERVIANLPEILQHKGADLEHEMEAWKSHLSEQHEVYPDFYFNYRYGTYGFFVGVLVGTLLSYLVHGAFYFGFVGFVTSILLICGVLYGVRLDAKLKKQGKNY